MALRNYAQVWGDVLLQFVAFGDGPSFEAYAQVHADCTFVPTDVIGSPMTHYVVDGAVVPVPAAPTPTSRWVPHERTYVDLYSLDDARRDALQRVNAGYAAAVGMLAAGYPAGERESWPVQTSEAAALQANDQAVTPWIDAAAQARGLTRADLAARIVALDTAYRAIHGQLSGTRQRLEGVISTTSDLTVLQATSWPVPSSTVPTTTTP